MQDIYGNPAISYFRHNYLILNIIFVKSDFGTLLDVRKVSPNHSITMAQEDFKDF
jgi:hypothetical protein